MAEDEEPELRAALNAMISNADAVINRLIKAMSASDECSDPLSYRVFHFTGLPRSP